MVTGMLMPPPNYDIREFKEHIQCSSVARGVTNRTKAYDRVT